MVWKAVLALLLSAASGVESGKPSASASLLPEGEISASSRKPLVREDASSLVVAVVDHDGKVSIGASRAVAVTHGILTQAACSEYNNSRKRECTQKSEQYFVDVRCCNGASQVSLGETKSSHKQKNFTEAELICHNLNLNLCSIESLEADSECVTSSVQGCFIERSRVWSNTTCTVSDAELNRASRVAASRVAALNLPPVTDFAMTAAGCAEKVSEWPPECKSTSERLNVRCCLKGGRRKPVLNRGVENCRLFKNLTFTDAEKLCGDKDLEICSAAALDNVSPEYGQCLAGCEIDDSRVWTSDSCTPGSTGEGEGEGDGEGATKTVDTTATSPTSSDPSDAQGCLIKEAGGQFVWIQHTDSTYNWVVNASNECLNKAGTFSSEHISLMTSKYMLNQSLTAQACSNPACEAETDGCLVKDADGYVCILHQVDSTRNWVDFPTEGCSNKARIASWIELELFAKRHGGVNKTEDGSNHASTPYPSYNLGAFASGIACEEIPCVLEEA